MSKMGGMDPSGIKHKPKMGAMGKMQGKGAMSSGMVMHHQKMEKRMDMMRAMMQMMMDHMPPVPVKP